MRVLAKLKVSLVALGLASSFFLEAKENSRFVQVTPSLVKDKDEYVFYFKVQALSGMQLSLEAPWSLEVNANKDFALPTQTLSPDAKQSQQVTFRFTGKNLAHHHTGKLNYKITTFVCTQDKKQCYRELIEDIFSW